MEALETVLVIAGLSAVGLLWIVAVAGAMHVVWESILAPLSRRLSRPEK